MDFLAEDLGRAKAELREANAEYTRKQGIWDNLTSRTSEKDVAKAKEAKGDAERVVIRIQKRIDQILEEMKLAQGKFIFLFTLLSG
jgi:hypothetical protein